MFALRATSHKQYHNKDHASRPSMIGLGYVVSLSIIPKADADPGTCLCTGLTDRVVLRIAIVSTCPSLTETMA